MKNQAQFIQKIGKDDKRLIANIGILCLPFTKNMPLNVNSVDCFPLHLCPYTFYEMCATSVCIGNYQPLRYTMENNKNTKWKGFTD